MECEYGQNTDIVTEFFRDSHSRKRPERGSTPPVARCPIGRSSPSKKLAFDRLLRAQLPRTAQVKLPASFVLPLPSYTACCGYGQSGRVMSIAPCSLTLVAVMDSGA